MVPLRRRRPHGRVSHEFGGSGSGETGGVGPGVNFGGGGGQVQGNAGVKSLSTVDAIYGAWNTPARGDNYAATPSAKADRVLSRAAGIADALFSDAKLTARSLGKALVA